MENTDEFYLGRIVDPQSGQMTDKPLLYDPADLTTHAVVVGMTGSGKTGLCMDLLEEAALHGVPAIMIDPKGDMTNALLHFPDLLPSDFEPWINPDEARRNGQSISEAAAEAAKNWREGLQSWEIGPERIRALDESAHFTIFTPGSTAGTPVNILASFAAPAQSWDGNQEGLREKISGTVTAILGLVGLNNIDPVRSREHILLSNIFEHAWSQGKDLNLSELILQTQSPPFSKLGVFDVNTFFPEKDRFGLAMLLNNILASPAFQTWIQGPPLDIGRLLWGEDGRPRHSVFYIAHLSDTERMFFVTLLYAAVESWMRAQPGTGSLRAIVYFDEIFGYLPPLGNPPSKEPILRMLKQARAFGVGQVLVTQNPVDVDYKGLSNAGTWVIGKLQTDQDKQRLLDGLEGALGGGMDRRTYDQILSRLGKRQFLLHNVHEKGPQLFGTRWAMNYLAGPLTRAQFPALMALSDPLTEAVTQTTATARPASAGAPAGAASAAPAAPAPEPAGEFRSSRPAAPSGIAEYFLPNNLTLSQALKKAGQPQADARSLGLVYRPVLLAQASVRYLNRKYNLDLETTSTTLVEDVDRRGMVHWEDFITGQVDPREFDSRPAPQARFALLEAPLSEPKTLSSLQKDFLDWVYRSSRAVVRAIEPLKLYAGPEVSAADFRRMAAEVARKNRDVEERKATAGFDRKLRTLEDRLAREERELAEDESDLSQRKMEELGTHAENIFGLFGGRKSSRRLTSSLSKRRMTSKAKASVEETRATIKDLKDQIAELEEQKAQALEEVNAHWGDMAGEITEISVNPLKKDVLLDLFGVAWFPYHLAEVDGRQVELPGFSAE